MKVHVSGKIPVGKLEWENSRGKGPVRRLQKEGSNGKTLVGRFIVSVTQSLIVFLYTSKSCVYENGGVLVSQACPPEHLNIINALQQTHTTFTFGL